MKSVRHLSMYFVVLVLVLGVAVQYSVAQDKAGVKALLKEYEDAFNANDTDRVIAVFHPNAKIKTKERGTINREEYREVLAERYTKWAKFEISAKDKNIKIEGNKAVVKAKSEIQTSSDLKWYSGRPTINMVFENGKWYIMD